MAGAEGAAALLDVNPHTLRRQMRQLGVDWRAYHADEGQRYLPPAGAGAVAVAGAARRRGRSPPAAERLVDADDRLEQLLLRLDELHLRLELRGHPAGPRRLGAFREDLFYRIGVFKIRIPPLRERPDDLPELAAHFARRSGLRLAGVPLVPSAADIALLRRYTRPGNVRELAAVLERAAILGGGRRLEIAAAVGDEPALERRELTRRAESERFPTLAEATRAHIARALEQTHGRIEGPGGAAALLDVNPHTLRGKMRKLDVDWRAYRRG